ncbi:MAG TPA: hypothetical protein VFS47_07010 [Steroidobacteraceae bacterium]|nr:hypothetical protein [Steroidobacteraceae bacterium]
MTPQFREQYADRGRDFRLSDHTRAEDLDSEDLFALIGFLADLARDKDPEAQILQFAPLGSPPGSNPDHVSPPKNNGLVEG